MECQNRITVPEEVSWQGEVKVGGIGKILKVKGR